jgi:hypothetical protein
MLSADHILRRASSYRGLSGLPFGRANDVLPAEYHHQYHGWTIDGAYAHRARPESPWQLMTCLNLTDKIAIAIIEDEWSGYRKATEAETLRLKNRAAGLADAVRQMHATARTVKDFEKADHLREVLIASESLAA